MQRRFCGCLPRSWRSGPFPEKEIEATIEKLRAAFQAPGVAVAIVDGERVAFAKGFGVKRQGRDEPVTADTRFAIASTTKAFTTAAIALLVDEGKMQWDDPVRKHLPAFQLADPQANGMVTLRDIVSHRTGLSRNDAIWYNTLWPREEILRRIAEVPLTKSFRSTYQYQNIMFLAAGEAVARCAGMSWEKFVGLRLLEPLGMNNTGFSPADAQAASDVASPHIKRKGTVVEVPWKDITSIGPAGTMNSSVRDLARWTALHINKGVFEGRRIISAKEIEETHSPQTIIREDTQTRELNPESHLNAYGLGWRLQDYRGRFLISHGGAIDGFRAQVAFLPDERWGVVVLTNLGQTTMADGLRFALIDILLDLPRKDWAGVYLAAAKKAEDQAAAKRKEREAKRVTGTKPSLPLSEYSGVYENPGYGQVVVRAMDENLTLAWGGHTIRLQHWHYDTFESPEDAIPLEQTSVTFRLGKDAETASLEFLDQEFKRVRKEGEKK